MNFPRQNTPILNTSFLFILFSFFLSINLSAQGDFCVEATEFCPFGNQDAVTFPAGTGGVPQIPEDDENDYGCLGTIPNPAWYYIEIGTAGSIQVELTNSNNQDIDFALWGPFENLNAAFDSCGALSYPYDCSYSPSANEDVNINQAQVGQAYLLLITNFSNSPTNISGEATGTGEISCCMLALDQGEACSASSEFDCFCWNRGLDLQLTNSGGEIPVDFCGPADSYRWASFNACYPASTIEISAANCGQVPSVKAQLFSDCVDLTPYSQCLEFTSNMSEFLTDLEGNTDLDFNVGETYSLLIAGSSEDTCTYQITTSEIVPTTPVFEQDTLAGSFSVCPNDTVTYSLPAASGVGNYEVEFTGIDTEIAEITLDSFTVFYGELEGTLCVNAVNETGTVSLCQNVTILSTEECEASVSIQASVNRVSFPLLIAPNPVQYSFRFFTNDIDAKWEVINTAGQILQSGKVRNETTLVSVQDLPSGVYFLRVKGKEMRIGKFVVD